ncbi:MAG: superoxide dismutase family protein [Bacillota bacterium]
MNTSFTFDAMQKPVAAAILKGSDFAPDLTGIVRFYPADSGSFVSIVVRGLPELQLSDDPAKRVGPFAFHIHEGKSCGSPGVPEAFTSAGGHYNPKNLPHPLHAGDLPTIYPNHGYANMTVYTDRFTPGEVIGRTVILHKRADDYHSQPAGNAGERIACGEIRAV